MPRPPILPIIDWKEVFEKGQDWADWLKRGESPENQENMDKARQEIDLGGKAKQLLAKLPKKVYVVAIAEDWCGDVVRHAPVLQALADNSDGVSVRFIFREDRPDVFARYLTNGGEAIPKFIFLSEDWVETGNWGALPYACKELIARGKACGDIGSARKLVGEIYESEPGRMTTIQELCEQIDVAVSTSPVPRESVWSCLG